MKMAVLFVVVVSSSSWIEICMQIIAGPWYVCVCRRQAK